LVCRRDFDLRLPLVKFDCAGDADDLPLEHGDPQVSRHFGTGCNEAMVAFFKIAAFPVQLGKKPGLLGLIFRKAQNKVQDPAKLRRLIGGPDRQRRMAI